MTQDAGFIISVDESIRTGFRPDRIGEISYSVSDVFCFFDKGQAELSIALLSFSPKTIDYISLAKRGKRVVTSKWRVDFSTFISLKGLEMETIDDYLGDNLSRYYLQSSKSPEERMSIDTWDTVVAAIKSERPEVLNEFNRLISLTKYAGLRLRGEGSNILLQEREALGISLDIFSGGATLRNQVLTQWAPPEEYIDDFNEIERTATLNPKVKNLPSFLMGLPEKIRSEESAIQHDMMNWAGETAKHSEGFSSFEQGGRQLSVMYANRNALEATLGVDLIYFNEAFNQFVLVQYKLMSMDDRTGVQSYRPNNSQFKEELRRMDDFYDRYKTDEVPKNDFEFRLNPDGFFFKLVPNKGLIAASGELSKGMYLPRKYVHFLISANGPVGPRNGSIINFENTKRYLSNSEFVSNVRLGRVGSYGSVSKYIIEIIKSYYNNGRAVLIAKESEKVTEDIS